MAKVLISDPIFLEILKLDGYNRKRKLFFLRSLSVKDRNLFFIGIISSAYAHAWNLPGEFRANKAQTSDELVKQRPSSGSCGALNMELHGLGCQV